MKNARYLVSSIEAALKAGKAILQVYESDFAVETKDDRSPLTQADKQSQDIIQSELENYGVPFISEEGVSTPYMTRKEWSSIWIVDPLDGTKEFVKRNGEFTVNIALVEERRPILGVVYAPVPRWLYFASEDIGAHKVTDVDVDRVNRIESGSAQDRLDEWIRQGTELPIAQDRQMYTIAGSRSHGSPELEAFVEKKRKEIGDIAFIAAGSSLKICMVAEGSADIYPRLGPTMEWDTAAGHAVAECSGAKVMVHESAETLTYNKADLLNPWFVVER